VGSGSYDREAFIRILRYARARHIEVIPEVDVPGHARAAIVSMQARHDLLMEEGDEAAARRYLLRHPDDESVYQSVQGWNDNVIDVCMPSTYEFLRYVVDDIVEMYREAGAPLTTIHTGGDEVPGGVWERSPACEALRAAEGDVHLPSLFLDRMSEINSEHGLVTAGWEEVALRMDHWEDHAGKVPDPARREKGILPYVWNSIWGEGSEELAYRLANAGFDIILSSASNLYFDLAYDKHPEEPGYYWAGFVDMQKPFELEPFDLFRSAKEDLLGNPIDPEAYADSEPLTHAGRSRIIGIQGQLWGENARSVELMEYLAFPRMIVLAERAWAQQPEWSKEAGTGDRDSGLAEAWREFANRLGQRELTRLNQAFGRVSFRIPPPGAVIEDGWLKANVALPGLEIRYTTDGSVPHGESALYEGPVEVTSPVHLMTFDSRARGSRIVRVDVAPQ
jgi:hexosaminidase